MNPAFCDRPMVERIKQIFNDPVRPNKVTQESFDMCKEDLVKTANKAWHEIDQSDYWHYLNDLCYADLQQDLFDYLFPALLIRWWEGQLSRFGGPASECDFYRAIVHGRLFEKMMGEPRRHQVLDWVTDAYMEGVDAWGGNLSVIYKPEGPFDLHGPLWSFNALGRFRAWRLGTHGTGGVLVSATKDGEPDHQLFTPHGAA